MRIGARVTAVSVSAPVMRLPTAMEAGNRERAEFYRSHRWRRLRAAFLRLHPICCTRGCGRRAAVVDHREGHQREDWRARFWDAGTWQPMCGTCHAAKSARELAAWSEAGENYPKGVSRPKKRSLPPTAWGIHERVPTDIKRGPLK
jgi:hypothetical protein